MKCQPLTGSLRRSALSAAVTAALVLLIGARAGAAWMLTRADFSRQPVRLISIDQQTVRCAALSGDQQVMVVPLDRFLSLDEEAVPSPAGGLLLVLRDGDQIWGVPGGCRDEQLTWHNRLLGEMRVPLSQILAITADERPLEPRPAALEDRVELRNGDSAAGIVTDITQSHLALSANGAEMHVPLNTVLRVQFAQVGPVPRREGRAFQLRLVDGSLITASSLNVDADSAELHLKAGTRKLPLGSITRIEQLDGPVSWLSSRQPSLTVQVPFFGGRTWPTRMDRSVDGSPIRFGRRTFARGIGVHAYSRLEWELDGSYQAFRTQYAMASQERSQYADVTVRIKLDGRIVHERVNFRAGVLAEPVLIDLPPQARLLTLEVDYGEANDTQDRFNWIEPALLKVKPAGE